jgi:UDP-galactopyranose mutase
VVYEYPRADGDPYYPVPRAENAEIYKRYEAEAEALTNVTFVGRLATYKYYNMDQVVGQALAAFKRLRQTHEQALERGFVVDRARASAGLSESA